MIDKNLCVDEIFEFQGKKYKVVIDDEFDCDNCDLNQNGICLEKDKEIPNCNLALRIDKNNVVFKEV